jgi:4-hydroxy-tetrahydrodipicolinate synthase
MTARSTDLQAIAGVYNIMATPFNADRQVDTASIRRLVEFQIDKGAYGLTILGVLGEAAKLSVAERGDVVTTVLDAVAGRVPVIVGTSHQDVGTCIALSQAALASGASGVMVAPPRLDAPTDANVIAFYAQVAGAISGPLIVQDFPPVTNVTFSAPLLAAMADQLPNLKVLKLEDPPLMQKIGAIRALTNRYAIFGGLGGMFFLEELYRGAAGTMTGFAFTEILVAVYEAYRSGQVTQAEAIFDRYLPLIRFENQQVINLPIRKELLYRRGAIATPLLRDPFTPIDADTHREIDAVLRRVGISDPTQKITFA